MKTALTIFSSVTFMKEVSEGVGTKVRRLLPVAGTEQLDPFLLFDYFNGKLPGGFPDHPHRGFETVTYLLKGQFFHEDFKGHKGTLSPGGVQWMTAGRGIVHSEMPASETESSEGYQLWINLPKAKKMVPPNYQEFLAEQIPEFRGEGFSVKVIAGEFEGVKGGVEYSHPIEYVVFSMKSGAKASYTFKKEWNGLLVVSEGEVEVNGEKVQKFHGGIFNRRAEDAKLSIVASKDSTFNIISGQPINEPMARMGPFVMNTREELQQAFDDYTYARNGFEARLNWKSEISKLSKHHGHGHDSDEDM